MYIYQWSYFDLIQCIGYGVDTIGEPTVGFGPLKSNYYSSAS